MMAKFTTGDLYCKIKSRFTDLVLTLYWRMRLGKLGRGSRLKRGVRIDGNPRRIRIGSDFKIWDRCFIGIGTGKITIGNDGLIGVNSYINASDGEVRIGNHVAIAAFCQIYSYSHHYAQGKLVTGAFKVGDVIIEDNVLIGSNVVILPGVTIHRGAVIAAGAVVTADVPANTIAGGLPAKVIRKREP
jgi:acetyltransferase-like isoleucine patch superfamily enzyme